MNTNRISKSGSVAKSQAGEEFAPKISLVTYEDIFYKNMAKHAVFAGGTKLMKRQVQFRLRLTISMATPNITLKAIYDLYAQIVML